MQCWRFSLIVALSAILVGCAAQESRPVRYYLPMSDQLDVSFDSISQNLSGEIVANMRITNFSSDDICLTRDSVENANSFVMNFYARDGRGRLLPHRDFGLIPPPVAGERVLKAGEQILIPYDLGSRFRWLGERPSRVEFLATYDFKLCASRESKMTTTEWMPLDLSRISS